MFQVPHSKRYFQPSYQNFELAQLISRSVRREDLYPQSLSSESELPDAALEVLFQERLEQSYNIFAEADDQEDDAAAAEPTTAGAEDQEEAFDFRLFSTPKAKASGAEGRGQRVVIRSPSPDSGGRGFTQPDRPESYYFAPEPTDERKRQFEAAAMSGEEVLRELDTRWV